MSKFEFLPGVWEDGIDVSDFINLNRAHWKGEHFLSYEHQLSILEGEDVIRDKNKKFKYLVSFLEEKDEKNGENEYLFLNEDAFYGYIETSEKKKLIELGILKLLPKKIRMTFFQPDLSIIPLYGTRYLLKFTKQYIKNLDKQFQTPEWIQRKVSQNLSIKAIEQFEKFAEHHKVKVKKPAETAAEVANSVWISSLYCWLEQEETPFGFFDIFNMLDIFIERDIKEKRLDEKEAQRIVDELYLKLAGLKSQCDDLIPFDFSYSIASGQINKTTYRLLESANTYREYQIPFQIIFNEDKFPNDIQSKVDKLFAKGHPIALSQSLRKRNSHKLSLTANHTFFRNYEDMTFQFGSFDLEKGLLMALNGGRDIISELAIQQITQPIVAEKLTFENAMKQFNLFLGYYITLYGEYINGFLYYYDHYHPLHFRNALTSNYPFYLVNIFFHKFSNVVEILTSIYLDEYEVEKTSKGFIKQIIPKTDKREQFIGAMLNDMIHTEINRMVFYKDGHYNLVLFSEQRFFIKEDENELMDISPMTFYNTSYSGYLSVNPNDFLNIFKNFRNTNYSHMRLEQKF